MSTMCSGELKRGIILSKSKTELCPLTYIVEVGLMVTNNYIKFQRNTSKSIGNMWNGMKNLTKSVTQMSTPGEDKSSII